MPKAVAPGAANDLDRFHLAGDVIDRVPRLAARAAYVKQVLRDKLLDHKAYVHEHGEDMPEVLSWQWGKKGVTRARSTTRDTSADN